MSLMQCDADPQPRAKAKWRGKGTRRKFFSAYSIRDILAAPDRKGALVALHRPAAGGLATYMSFTYYLVGS